MANWYWGHKTKIYSLSSGYILFLAERVRYQQASSAHSQKKMLRAFFRFNRYADTRYALLPVLREFKSYALHSKIKYDPMGHILFLAERVRFELTVPFTARRFSRPLP